MEAHPEITSIIKKRDEIHTLMYAKRHYTAAVECIQGLFYELEEKDQESEQGQEAITLIEKEVAVFSSLGSIELKPHLKKSLPKYKQWLRVLNKILWEGGYLKNTKYYGDPITDDDFKEKAEEQ